jgi:hypothetical protein
MFAILTNDGFLRQFKVDDQFFRMRLFDKSKNLNPLHIQKKKKKKKKFIQLEADMNTVMDGHDEEVAIVEAPVQQQDDDVAMTDANGQESAATGDASVDLLGIMDEVKTIGARITLSLNCA